MQTVLSALTMLLAAPAALACAPMIRPSGVVARLATGAVLLCALQGCVAAVPIATGLAVTGASAVGTNAVLDGSVSHANRVQAMSCAQLRAEYQRLQDNALGRLNPTWSVRRATVLDRARQRGCPIS